MRIFVAAALALVLAGCGEEQYTPAPPQPDTSLEIGDEGVLHFAGAICNSEELYRMTVSEAAPGDFDRLVDAIDRGDCTHEDTEDLEYKVVDISPIEEDFTGCKLMFMTTIEAEGHGKLYVSSDDIPGITQDQIKYRSDCLEKLREQQS